MVCFYCCSNVRRCDAIDRARVVVVCGCCVWSWWGHYLEESRMSDGIEIDMTVMLELSSFYEREMNGNFIIFSSKEPRLSWEN